MPYSGPDDPDLPSNVKKKSKAKRAQWVEVWNSAYASCTKDGGKASDCESSAFAQANGVMKKREVVNVVNPLQAAWQALVEAFAGLGVDTSIKRAVEEVDSWDGAASNYDDTDAYCAACLIDVNPTGEDKKQALCKLPVKAPGSSSYADKAIMAAAGALSGARGGLKKPDGVDDATWTAAVKSAANKVITAYGQMEKECPDGVYEAAGKTPPERARALNSLGEQLYPALSASEHQFAYVHDLFVEGDKLFLVCSEAGELFRVAVSVDGNDKLVLGDWTPVTQQFVPIAVEQTARTIVVRQADGRRRWIAVSATAILNKDGEIDSRELFDNMARRAADTGEYPYRTFYHLGETLRMGQADLLARDGYLYITSGLFDENNVLAEAIVRDMEANPGKWGDSISFKPTKGPELIEVAPGVKVPVYTDGINREISTCLATDAAAWFVACELEEVNRNMNDRLKKLLTDLLGEDRAQEFITKADDTNRTIEDGGLIARTGQAAAASAPATPDAAKPAPATPDAAKPAPATPDAAKPAPAATRLEMDVSDPEVQRAMVEALAQSDAFGAALASRDAEIKRLAAREVELTSRLAAQDKLLADLKIAERLGALERDDDERRRDWEADRPAKITVRAVTRPRDAHKPGAQPPSDADNAAGEDSFDQIAERNLAGLPAY